VLQIVRKPGCGRGPDPFGQVVEHRDAGLNRLDPRPARPCDDAVGPVEVGRERHVAAARVGPDDQRPARDPAQPLGDIALPLRRHGDSRLADSALAEHQHMLAPALAPRLVLDRESRLVTHEPAAGSEVMVEGEGVVFGRAVRSTGKVPILGDDHPRSGALVATGEGLMDRRAVPQHQQVVGSRMGERLAVADVAVARQAGHERAAPVMIRSPQQDGRVRHPVRSCPTARSHCRGSSSRPCRSRAPRTAALRPATCRSAPSPAAAGGSGL
jgi:hypothetical protein